jgi:hypothetical protein
MFSELGESNIMPEEMQYRQRRTPHSRYWSKPYQEIDGGMISMNSVAGISDRIFPQPFDYVTFHNNK